MKIFTNILVKLFQIIRKVLRIQNGHLFFTAFNKIVVNLFFKAAY